jgi:hypothetical protein
VLSSIRSQESARCWRFWSQGAGDFGRFALNARLGASALSEEQKKIDMEQRLYHKSHKLDHQAKSFLVIKGQGQGSGCWQW